ncbi:MAG: hypothetical protein E7521_03680 [Ruminococcaceae bacterium]|nr:hypothetical protein [Oscillospiraceae bacterium]
MREKTPQDYANELLKMYRENAAAIAQSENAVIDTAIQELTPTPPRFEDGTGGLQLNVTTFNHLYPVKNALVTVFTGSGQNKTVIETGITDESGKSGVFNPKTPPAADSQQAENGGVAPYAKYNVSVKSDGYVEQIAMNVPVFSGVLSVQGMDLLPVTAAGKNTAPQIIEEGNDYNL